MSTDVHQPVTDESKLQLTHRLNREGRWMEANKWKNSRIKQLRSTGLKRSEASQQAWSEVSEEFAPMTDEQIEQLAFTKALLRAEFPPVLGGADAEACSFVLPDVWWVICTLIAVYDYREVVNDCHDFPDLFIEGRLVVHAPTPSARRLGLLALQSPAAFLLLAREHLTALLPRCDDEVRAELTLIREATERLLDEQRVGAG